MTVYTTRLGGSDWVDGDILYAADQNDTISAAVTNTWTKYRPFDNYLGKGLVKFSSTIWQTAAKRSTDAGANWSWGGYNAVGTEDIAFNSGLQGIAFDRSDGSASFSVDGGSWTISSTQPGNVSTINAGHLFSTTIGACGGTAASGNYIWYTSNGGDDWTQATTGPTTEVTAIVMASATVGYAVDLGKSIWKTTDAGANWTDTTANLGTDTRAIIAIDADTILASGNRLPIVMKYVNSTNTVTALGNSGISSSTNAFTNWIKSTNGNYYTLMWIGSVNELGFFYLFKYDGTNLFAKVLPQTYTDNANTGWMADSVSVIPSLIEESNILYVNMSTNVLEIDIREA